MRLIARYDAPNAYSVWWHFSDDTGGHFIAYDTERLHTYDAREACHRYGEFVRHAAESAGLFDREEES